MHTQGGRGKWARVHSTVPQRVYFSDGGHLPGSSTFTSGVLGLSTRFLRSALFRRTCLCQDVAFMEVSLGLNVREIIIRLSKFVMFSRIDRCPRPHEESTSTTDTNNRQWTNAFTPLVAGAQAAAAPSHYHPSVCVCMCVCTRTCVPACVYTRVKQWQYSVGRVFRGQTISHIF